MDYPGHSIARDATPLPGMPSLRLRHPHSPEAGPSSDGGSMGAPEDEFWPWSHQRPAKEAPLPMCQKRLVRQFRGQASGSVSTWQLWLATQHHTLKQTGSEIRNVLSYLKMWKKSLHNIEGHFGTGIGSYFSFLRFLVLLNICTFVLIAAFVVIPVITFERLKGETQWTTTAPPPQGGNCTEYDPTRQGLVSFYEYALDILSGTGLLEHSYLFYGFYPPGRVQVYGFSYNSPIAYLLTMVSFFLMSFCWTVH
ncbi:transmembrane channel-like protein 7, partial [Scyliorhinus torazame]|uniref:transmembrane channel-like protein 7 n=1 Tax=Scyliorhinus torazame TaxID=75743 RepID=UPI003B5C379E